MEDEIVIKFHMEQSIMGLGTFGNAIKMMDSVKEPNKHIILPTKFRIVGYEYKMNGGYHQVIFEIAPIDNIKMDDLLK